MEDKGYISKVCYADSISHSVVMSVSGYFPLTSVGERRRDSFTKGNFYPACRQKGEDR